MEGVQKMSGQVSVISSQMTVLLQRRLYDTIEFDVACRFGRKQHAGSTKDALFKHRVAKTTVLAGEVLRSQVSRSWFAVIHADGKRPLKSL